MNKRKQVSNVISDEPKKIVLFGEGGIGKSTLFKKILSLKNDEYQFQKNYDATDNFDFNRIKIDTNVGVVIIDLWDTAGQEHTGGKLRDAYLKGADGVLLLYDVTKRETIEHMPKWLTQIKKIAPNIPVAVIGNKAENIDKLQQYESIKIRDTTIEKDLGHKIFKNFLISIKEDIHVESVSGYFSSKTIEIPGCLVGLEYILTNIFKQSITIN